jgi:hypothetical protein
MLPAIPGLHPQRTTVVVRREKRGQCQTRTLFGAQPRSERTEKARSAHSFIVRWAVHPRVRSGPEETTCIRIQRPRKGRV